MDTATVQESLLIYFSMAQQPLVSQGLLIVENSLSISARHTTVSRSPLDELSARRKDLYLTTHNTHNRQTSMPLAEFEPAIPSSELPQTHALDRAANGTGDVILVIVNIYLMNPLAAPSEA